MGRDSSPKESRDMSKKRKKEATIISSSPSKVQILNPATVIDAYKGAIEFEEEEAVKRNVETDSSIYFSTCAEFKTLVKEIAILKTSNSSQAQAQIAEKRIQASLLFVTLKKLSRLEKFRTNQSRERLHKAKQQGDSCHLQLQNLLYEIMHLKKEVTKCLQFKSKDEDIDLVPIEEFYKDAPETISRPDVTRDNAHQAKLARLEWELSQRKQLAALCEDLQADKEKVATEINKKHAQLESLAPMLKNVLEVGRPIQESLGLTTGPSLAQQQTSQLLPHPLYFLFVQADALREAGDKMISVKIEGSEEEAQRLNQTLTEATALEDSDSDTQEEVVEKKRHHRKKTRSDRQEERRKQLLTAHPLSVVLTVTLKDGLACIVLHFSYLVNLHVVTVKPKVKISTSQVTLSSVSAVSKLLESENVLAELFPGDFGEKSPNLANIYQLKQLSIEKFDYQSLGLAYVWTQRCAGLNFSSEGGSSGGGEGQGGGVVARQQLSQISLPLAVAAVKKRLRARIHLCTQLQALESGRLPNIPEVRAGFPQKLLGQLAPWFRISWQVYQQLGFTRTMIANGCVTERDILYKGTLTRDKAWLNFAVAIKHCYPLLPPVFSLQAAYESKSTDASNNDSLRDIEREVNVYFKELIKDKGAQSPHSLLTAQLLRLLTDFDLLLEASLNTDFPRDKTFIQSNRGRNRAWPFKQTQVGEGIFHFTQR